MKRIFKVFGFFIITLLLLISITAIKLLSGYKMYNDVKYGEKDINVMDIYLPRDAKNNKENGCVLFIHGGSWSSGDKKEEDIRCRLLASHGYISATMNYTLNNGLEKDYNVFNVLDEIELSLLKIKEFASENGINITKFATSGYSAGAHLSMLYSYSRINSSPVEIAFTANMAGPSDISEEVWGENMSKRIGKLLMGLDVDDEKNDYLITNEFLLSISPTSYINESTPPSIIMHGGKDDVVPINNANLLISKFNEFSVPYEFIFLEDSDHMLIQNPIKHLGYLSTLLKFCNKYFI